MRQKKAEEYNWQTSLDVVPLTVILHYQFEVIFMPPFTAHIAGQFVKAAEQANKRIDFLHKFGTKWWNHQAYTLRTKKRMDPCKGINRLS